MKKMKASLHWWYQRLSAILLVPLIGWFLYTLSNSLKNENTKTLLKIYQKISIQYPLSILVLCMALVIHMRIGMQEVIEDYVNDEKTKLMSIIFLDILSIRIITDTFIYLYI